MKSLKEISEDLEELTRITPSSIALAILFIASIVYLIKTFL